MNLKYLFFSFLLLISLNIRANIDWSSCYSIGDCSLGKVSKELQYSKVLGNRKKFYVGRFKMPKCDDRCWVFIGEIADTALVTLNGSILASFDENLQTSYITPDSIMLPLPSVLLRSMNVLIIEVTDQNKNVIGINVENVKIGNHSNLEKLSHVDWLARTGGSLLSAFTLLVISVGIFITILFHRSRKLLILFIYSIVAGIYIFSFSEYPKKYYSPEIMSGKIHFFLRLLQDYILATTFIVFFDFRRRKKLIGITALYLIPFLGIIVSTMLNIDNYEVYLNIIRIFAPLVAFPMFVGTVYVYISNRGKVRNIMLCISIIFLAFQINDLLVFWNIYKGHYTVKWYLPLLVIYLIAVYIYELFLESKLKGMLEARGRVASQIAHDIRSPLTALKNLSSSTEQMAIINRVIKIANNFIKPRANIQIISVDEMLKDFIQEKSIEITGLNIKLHCEAKETCVLSDSIGLFQCFSNIINNSIEANSDNIVINLKNENKYINVEIKDNGCGLSKFDLKHVLNFGYSKKNNNSGIGLSQASEFLKNTEANLTIESQVGVGTIIKLKFKNIKIDEIVLIDNEKYIRKSWEMSAEKKSIKIYTFSDVEEFKLVAEKFDKGIYIFVDSELDNGQKGEILAEEIFNLGFKNILLATGKLPEEFDLKLYPWIKGIQSKEFPI